MEERGCNSRRVLRKQSWDTRASNFHPGQGLSGSAFGRDPHGGRELRCRSLSVSTPAIRQELQGQIPANPTAAPGGIPLLHPTPIDGRSSPSLLDCPGAAPAAPNQPVPPESDRPVVVGAKTNNTSVLHSEDNKPRDGLMGEQEKRGLNDPPVRRWGGVRWADRLWILSTAGPLESPRGN